MFLLIKTMLTYECGSVDVTGELVAKSKDRDVLDVVISATLRNAYEEAVLRGDNLTAFNGYVIEEIEDSDAWLLGVERTGSLVIDRDLCDTSFGREITTYTIVEDKNYGGKAYE